MASQDRPTFGDLLRFLRAHVFVVEPARDGRRVCRHPPSDSWIVLAERPDTDTVRLADLIAARKQLIERGLIEESEFARFLEVTAAEPTE